jgi:DNA-binding transcriptional ArsR family regulator
MSDLCSEIERFGKGIGNASRYRLVEALFKGPKTVSQLVSIVRLSQPAVSQHLKTLKTCGVVQDKRRGQEVLYSLNTEHVLTLLKSLVGQVSKDKKQ